MRCNDNQVNYMAGCINYLMVKEAERNARKIAIFNAFNALVYVIMVSASIVMGVGFLILSVFAQNMGEGMQAFTFLAGLSMVIMGIFMVLNPDEVM